MDEDMIIEEFARTRDDRDELRILRQRPSMLGDLIRFANQKETAEVKG